MSQIVRAGAPWAGIAAIVAATALSVVVVVTVQSIAAAGDLWIDYVYYRDLGARWMGDGSYYLPRQLAGPYDVQLMGDVLYPPSALVLFVPAAVLPAILWWLVPTGVTLWCIVAWRPSWTGVAIILALLCWPRAHAAFLFGNSDMWAMAGVAAGLRWGWPAALLFLKPTLAPFALAGIGHRSWWLLLGIMAALILPALPLWLDYITAMRNISAGLDYSFGSVPIVVIPLVAWATSSRRSGRRGVPDRHSSQAA